MRSSSRPLRRLAVLAPGWLDRATVAQSLLAGVAALLGSYAVVGFTPAFVVAPVESFLVRWMPGQVIRFAITVLGDLGKKLNLLAGISLTVGGFAALSFVTLSLARRAGRPSNAGTDATPAAPVLAAVVTGGAAVVAAFALTSGEAASSLGAGLAAGIAAGVSEIGLGTRPRDADPSGRRRLLGSIGALALGGAAAGYLGSRGGLSSDAEIESDPDVTQPADVLSGNVTGTNGSRMRGGGTATADGSGESVAEAVDARLAEAAEKSLDVDGIEPLVSENFYRTDINNAVPTPDVEGWSLSITGAVASGQSFEFADIASIEPQHRFVTLRCVGENLNGNKMDNALWTGVPVGPLIERANPRGDYVMARAVDDYFEEFPLEALRGSFLAYGMNGERLPRRHGYPVRLLVPGHWGEINVKWIDEIEVLTNPDKGYWEEKGWHGTGPVKTVAKIKAINRMGDRIQVGGHAYAGTRGVSAVEVSIDGGDTWQEATVSDRLPGQDVWRQWSHEYDSPGSRHEVVARAIEDDGTVQPEEETGSFPSGPSGWVTRTVQG